MRAGTAAGAWWRQRPEGQCCTDEALMQAIHTSTIYRQAKCGNLALLDLITVPARYCRVEINYLDRRGSFINYFNRRDTRRGTFNNSLLAKWPNLGCFQVVLCGRGTILMSEPRRGTRVVFFNNPVFKLTRQYRAGTVVASQASVTRNVIRFRTLPKANFRHSRSRSDSWK